MQDLKAIKAIKELVAIECQHRQINPKVIEAIISVESATWSPTVAKYEKNFTNIYRADLFAKMFKVSLATEITLQKFSWGIMQIMGGTARDLGFNEWIPDLCKPEIGIHWGCEYFQKRCMDYVDLKDQIATYNAGSVRRKSNGEYTNQEYVDKVMSFFTTANR